MVVGLPNFVVVELCNFVVVDLSILVVVGVKFSAAVNLCVRNCRSKLVVVRDSNF